MHAKLKSQNRQKLQLENSRRLQDIIKMILRDTASQSVGWLLQLTTGRTSGLFFLIYGHESSVSYEQSEFLDKWKNPSNWYITIMERKWHNDSFAFCASYMTINHSFILNFKSTWPRG